MADYEDYEIDKALDKVLKASGSALRYYTVPKTLDDMRAAMQTELLKARLEGFERGHDVAVRVISGAHRILTGGINREPGDDTNG